MKEFASAAQRAEKARLAKEASEEFDPIELVIADRPMKFEYPGPGQIIYFSMVLASEEGELRRVGELINWVISLVNQDDRRFLRGLLLDSESGFDGDDIIDIVTALIEEWSGNPTDSPVASTPSRRSGGGSSTAGSRRAGSTRSRSTPVASAT